MRSVFSCFSASKASPGRHTPERVSLRASYLLLATITLTALPVSAQTAPALAAPTAAEDAATRTKVCTALDATKSKQRVCELRTKDLSGPLLAETITACSEHARSSVGWQACVDFAKAQPDTDRIANIAACNFAVANESQLRVCLRDASMLTAPIAPVILACKESASSASLFANCLTFSAPLAESAAATIVACTEHSKGGVKLAGSLREAAKLKAPKKAEDLQTLFKRTCQRTVKASAPLQKCVARANAVHQADAAAVVTECQLFTTNTDDFAQCLDNAAPLKERALQRLRSCRTNHTLTSDFLTCTAAPATGG